MASMQTGRERPSLRRKAYAHRPAPPSKRRPRMRRAALAVACVVAAGILLGAYGVRLYIVNDGFKGFPKMVYDRDDAAAYATTGKNPIAEGDVEVRVTSFAGLSADQVAQKYTDDDPAAFVEAANGGDFELLTVGVAVKNASEAEQHVFTGSYNLSSGGWENGVIPTLVPALNAKGATMNLDLAPGQEQQVVLPFYAYESQFGDAWSRLSQRDFNLVLSVQPKLYSIQLGHFDASS